MSELVWKAKWIWSKGEERPRNFYLCARKKFDISEKVEEAYAYITADSRYKLYINGRFVGRGPARCFPEFQYYDKYDIKKYLYPGRNVAAVLVHHYGENTGSYVLGRGGLLFQAEIETKKRKITLTSDESWKVKQCKSWDSNAPRVHFQLGFVEIYDANNEFDGWNKVGFDDSKWETPVIIGEPSVKPWTSLVPCDIPPLRETEILPVKVVKVEGREPIEHLYEINLMPILEVKDWTPRLGYLATYIHAPSGITSKIVVKTTFGIKVWINGKIVIDKHVHIPSIALEGVKFEAEVYLHEGWNKVLIKIEQIEPVIPFIISLPPIPSTWNFIFAITGLDLTFSASRDLNKGPTWMTIGPFDNPQEGGKCLGFDQVQPPEKELDFEKSYPGQGKKVKWLPIEPLKCKDVSFLMGIQKKVPLKDSHVEHIEGVLHGFGKYAEIQTAPREEICILLDFGREVVGYPMVKIGDGLEGAIIDMGYSEVLFEGDVNLQRGAVRHADRYIMKPGLQEWVLFEKRGFRYMQLTFRNCIKPVQLDSVRLNLATYPVEYSGSFECSDPLLNKIWEVSRYTLQLCMEDAYEDCPWRERAQWMGDARLEALFNYYAFGDTKLMRKLLRQIAQSQRPDGIMPALAPGHSGIVIPDFCLIWVMSLRDYYMFSDDLELIKELYPNVKKMFKWFETRLDEHDLLRDVPLWVHIDWSDVDKRGEVTALNCFYYKALMDAAWIAEVLSDDTQDDEYKKLAEKVKRSINERLWDKGRGAYVDCRVGDELSPRVGQQANSLAVLFDIAPPDRWDKIYAYILDETKLMTKIGSPYFMFYMLAGLWHAGRDVEALKLIRGLYGSMLDRGATTWWEVTDEWARITKTDIHELSHCHGWSSAPSHDLPAEVLGIKPFAPGWEKVLVSPKFGDLEWAKGVVPTIKGPIEGSWRITENGFKLLLASPKFCSLEIILPKKGVKGPMLKLDDEITYKDGKYIPVDTRIKKLSENEDYIRIEASEGGFFNLTFYWEQGKR